MVIPDSLSMYVEESVLEDRTDGVDVHFPWQSPLRRVVYYYITHAMSNYFPLLSC